MVGNLRPIGPKKENDASIGVSCSACGKLFKEGDYTTLIALGPGDDKEEQEKCKLGESYNAVAVEVHWKCATGKEVD